MYFLGIDVGSISTDLVVINGKGEIKEQLYLKTRSRPMETICYGLKMLEKKYDTMDIEKVGTTGSGRSLAGALVGADVIKNEITAHGAAGVKIDPEIKTIIEIGGQDSKLILLNDGFVRDFSMNTVCAAGTGSFLDRQAERMGIPIEEFGEKALEATAPTPIAGRCAVFAESDIIHQQQLGISEENLIAGLCKALVQNYMSNVAQGKTLLPKICFQGGVAANKGIKAAFEDVLQMDLMVPKEHKIMGAYGAALLAQELDPKETTKFKGFESGGLKVKAREFQCKDCSNQCKVVELSNEEGIVGCFQDRCGKYN
ncbi:MAG: acyl-CoA dehydratase activase [Anaerovoracaceae bacterium]